MSKNTSENSTGNNKIKIILVILILISIPIYIFVPWSKLKIGKSEQKIKSDDTCLNVKNKKVSQGDDFPKNEDSREEQPENPNDDQINNENPRNSYNMKDESTIKESVPKEEHHNEDKEILPELNVSYPKKDTFTADELLEFQKTLNNKIEPLIKKFNAFTKSFGKKIAKEYPEILCFTGSGKANIIKTGGIDEGKDTENEVDSQKDNDLDEIKTWCSKNEKPKKHETEGVEYNLLMFLSSFVQSLSLGIKCLINIDENINKLDEYPFIEKNEYSIITDYFIDINFKIIDILEIVILGFDFGFFKNESMVEEIKYFLNEKRDFIDNPRVDLDIKALTEEFKKVSNEADLRKNKLQNDIKIVYEILDFKKNNNKILTELKKSEGEVVSLSLYKDFSNLINEIKKEVIPKISMIPKIEMKNHYRRFFENYENILKTIKSGKE